VRRGGHLERMKRGKTAYHLDSYSLLTDLCVYKNGLMGWRC
jgi:hypothetical protein